MPGLLLLGFTGTLLDEDSTHRALDQTMTAVRRRFGLELAAEELSGRFSLALMEILRGEPEPEAEAEFLPLYDAAPEIFAGLMVSLGYAPTDGDKAWFAKRYRSDLRTAARVHRDALGALPRLGEEGWRLGIVTDADPRLVADVVDATPLGPLLGLRVSAAEAGHVKPHPAGYRLALQRAEADKTETVAVGASYERDLVAARAAGIERVVLVDRYAARTVDVPRLGSLARLAGLLRESA